MGDRAPRARNPWTSPPPGAATLVPPRLTGSWGGLRDELGKKGVVLDVDVLETPQGVVSGGRDTGWDVLGAEPSTPSTWIRRSWASGRAASSKSTAMSSFGHSVQQRTGALMPVNTATLLPEPGGPTSALMNLTFMQFFSPHFGVVVGKLYTLGGDDNAFAHDYHSDVS